VTIASVFNGFVRFLAPETAWAQPIPPPPTIVCNPLIGCGSGTANIVAKNAPIVLVWMLNIATAIALAVIIWSGFTMLLSMGDESKISKGRWNVLYALLGLVLVISAQVIVSVVGTTDFGQATGDPLTLVGNLFAAFITSARVILNITFVIVTVIAGIRMVYAQGKQEEFTKGKTMIIGAIFGALAINLGPALLRALAVLFP